MKSLLKHYLRVFWRNFLKNKADILLNLLGLTTGIACFLFCMLYVFYETSYDSYHVNRDRIGRVVMTMMTNGTEKHWATSHSFLAVQLPKRFPEIDAVVRFVPFSGRGAIKRPDRVQGITLGKVYYADKD